MLHERLGGGEEIALVDVREQHKFGQNHLLLASNIALSHLEIRTPALVPRPSTPLVLCDAGEGLAQQAGELLSSYGYSAVSVLDGGVLSWQEAGFELFSGVNVLSKVFGEYVEHRFDTPRLEASALNARLEAGEDLVILDSRPLDEFQMMCIPGGIDTPRGRARVPGAGSGARPEHHRDRQLRRAHPFDHWLSVTGQRRSTESRNGAQRRHHGVASRRTRAGPRQGASRRATVGGGAGLGNKRRRPGGRAFSREDHFARAVGEMAGRGG